MEQECTQLQEGVYQGANQLQKECNQLEKGANQLQKECNQLQEGAHQLQNACNGYRRELTSY